MEMNKQFNGGKYCCNHLWFVFLITNLLCFFLLLIDYSSLVTTKMKLRCLVNTKVEYKLNAITGKHLIHIEEEAINPRSEQDSCSGRYIYIHDDLPKRFNQDVIKNCHSLTRKTDKLDMCIYTENNGFGPQVRNSSGTLLNTNSWFVTNQFLLEVIFHNRMRSYDCLTNDSSMASAIFVPFYAGLDLRRYLWGYKTSVRDSSGVDLMSWLVQKPEWERMSGRDHFFVGGRISRDFRRKLDKNSEWGSKLRLLGDCVNMSMLTIESSLDSDSDSSNDIAIPYPTYFHPSSDREVLKWQNLIRQHKRDYLFSFVGAPRSKSKGSVRGNIIDQCLNSNGSCKLLDCSSNQTDCDNPIDVMDVLRSSIFCLQPPGDSLTRKSIFDSILAGCIPVLFHPGSAYKQYKWHLPKNYSKYSVYIPGGKLRDRNYRIKETLLGVSKGDEMEMREEVIRLIPRIIYGDPRSRLRSFEDAFDIAVKGILGRIEKNRRVIMEKNILS